MVNPYPPSKQLYYSPKLSKEMVLTIKQLAQLTKKPMTKVLEDMLQLPLTALQAANICKKCNNGLHL